MVFEQATISIVKSMSQQSLAFAWQRAAKGQSLPRFENFEPSSRGSDPRYLVIWLVDRTANDLDFVALYQGSFIQTAFQANWVSKRMSVVIPEGLRPAALAGARRCVANHRAIYMNYQAQQPTGEVVYCERLLLPFGDIETGVQQIVASMEPISFEGDVQLDRTLEDFVSSFKIVVAAEFAP